MGNPKVSPGDSREGVACGKPDLIDELDLSLPVLFAGGNSENEFGGNSQENEWESE